MTLAAFVHESIFLTYATRPWFRFLHRSAASGIEAGGGFVSLGTSAYARGKTRKAAITAHIDFDVRQWLKGEGYQTRLNAILRDAMTKDLTTQPKKALPASGKPRSPAGKTLAAKRSTAGHPSAELSLSRR